MSSKQPFKRHRFPAEIILCAVRMYLRYPLSYQDVTDLLAERGLDVDRSTVFRWVQKFGPELSKRAERHVSRASLNWHVDETYIRVGGKWRYLWRAMDANGQLVDFRLMPGQAHDLRAVPDLIESLCAEYLLADRAFDADWLRSALDEKEITPVIPPKSNRRFPATFDKDTYKWRHLIENYFGKLKGNRGIAMRSCKTDQSFAAFISLAATVIQLR